VILSGVVCMHRITHTQSLWDFTDTVPMVRKLCGGIRERLALVMTNWTVTSPELGWWRGLQLKDKFKKDVDTSCFENTQRSAWEILDSLVSPNERRVQRANKKFVDQDRISLETITDVTLRESLEQARREFTKVMKELKLVDKTAGWIKIHQEDEYAPPQYRQDPIIVKQAREDAIKQLLEAETQLEAVVDQLRDFQEQMPAGEPSGTGAQA
jgi:chaperonin cofactor prefoldin